MEGVHVNFPIKYNGTAYSVKALQNHSNVLSTDFEIISITNLSTNAAAFESVRFGNISMSKPPHSHFIYHLFMNKPIELICAIEDGLAKYMRMAPRASLSFPEHDADVSIEE